MSSGLRECRVGLGGTTEPEREPAALEVCLGKPGLVADVLEDVDCLLGRDLRLFEVELWIRLRRK